MHSIKKIILNSIRLSASLQQKDGSFPGGHNGPHNDQETPVRNTSHWIIANLYAWKYTGERSFRDVAEAGIDYLIKTVTHSGNYSVVSRTRKGKDRSNGLIGQAWIIEALGEAGWVLNREDALLVGESLFRRHRFDDSVCAWLTAPTNVHEVAKFDRTFNHQLWFAATGAILVRCGIGVHGPIRNFIDNKVANMKQYPNGLIHHSNPYFIANNAKQKLLSFARHARVLMNGEKVYTMSVGYHTFNTYALALIEKCMPDLEIASMGSVRRALGFLGSEEFQSNVGRSPYSFAYNPPGFEAAFSLSVLDGVVEPLEIPLMRAQVELNYDETAGHFTKNVADVYTSAARVYEAARLLEDD